MPKRAKPAWVELSCPKCGYTYEKYVNGPKLFDNRCSQCGHEWPFDKSLLDIVDEPEDDEPEISEGSNSSVISRITGRKEPQEPEDKNNDDEANNEPPTKEPPANNKGRSLISLLLSGDLR